MKTWKTALMVAPLALAAWGCSDENPRFIGTPAILDVTPGTLQVVLPGPAGSRTVALTVHNAGDETLTWTATPTVPWIQITSENAGTTPHGETDRIYVKVVAPDDVINGSAALDAQMPSGAIEFSSNGGDETVTIALSFAGPKGSQPDEHEELDPGSTGAPAASGRDDAGKAHDDLETALPRP